MKRIVTLQILFITCSIFFTGRALSQIGNAEISPVVGVITNNNCIKISTFQSLCVSRALENKKECSHSKNYAAINIPGLNILLQHRGQNILFHDLIHLPVCIRHAVCSRGYNYN